MIKVLQKGILALAIVFLFTGSVHANPLEALADRWNWWDKPMVQKKLDLTPAQVAGIRDIVRGQRNHIIDLKAVMEKKAFLLEDEVDRPDFDTARAMAAAEAFHQARSDMELARLRLIVEIRGILSQEQFDKVRDFHHRIRAEHHMGRPGEPGKSKDHGPR